MKKSYLIITLALCLAFVLGACGGEATTTPTPSPDATAGATATPEPTPVAHSTEYVARTLAFPDSLDPSYYGTGTVALDMTAQIYDGLVWSYRGNPQDIRGMIAESYTVSDDGMTYTFKIREGIKFHNGEDMKLSDIVYSYERWKDAPTSAVNAQIFVSCTADEENNTITIVVNTPAPAAILTFGTIAIVDEDVLGPDYDPINQVATTPELVVGTSAYKLSEWVQDDKIVLESVGEDWYGNDIYLGGNAPAITKLTYKTITDSNAAVIAFENKEINALTVTVPEDIDKAIAEEEEARANGEIPEVRVTFSSGAARLGIACSMLDPVVGCQGDEYTAEQKEAALNLRRAIASAMDRDAVNEIVFAGHGETVTQLTNPYTEGYTEDIEYYGYDVEKAKEYLAAAGYADGITLEFLYISDDQYSIDLATYVQEACRVVGITIELKGYDQGTWFNYLYEQKDFQLAYNSYTPTWNNPAVAYSSPWLTGNYWNPWSYSNERVDELLALAQMERDTETRVAYYTELNQITAASLAFIPLAGSRGVTLNNDNWVGFFTEGVATTTRFFMVFWDEDGLWSYDEDGLPWE